MPLKMWTTSMHRDCDDQSTVNCHTRRDKDTEDKGTDAKDRLSATRVDEHRPCSLRDCSVEEGSRGLEKCSGVRVPTCRHVVIAVSERESMQVREGGGRMGCESEVAAALTPNLTCGRSSPSPLRRWEGLSLVDEDGLWGGSVRASGAARGLCSRRGGELARGDRAA